MASFRKAAFVWAAAVAAAEVHPNFPIRKAAAAAAAARGSTSEQPGAPHQLRLDDGGAPLGPGSTVHPNLRNHPVRGIVRTTRAGTTGATAFAFKVPGSMLAGNGNLGLVIGSLPEDSGPGLTFALGKNDFWGTFDHIFFGGTMEHFSPGFLTLGVGRAAIPIPAAGWNPTFAARQQLRDGQLMARSYDASAAGSGGGYGLQAQAYVLSSRNVVVANVTSICPPGVATITVLANLSAQNSWHMPVHASRQGGKHTNEPVRLELRKHNRRGPSHPAVLAACSGKQLMVNGLRTFALTGETRDVIAIVNGSDTTSLCLEPAQNTTRVHTVRCARDTRRWRWNPVKRQIVVDAHNESESICLAIVNMNTTECPSSFKNQPRPRTVCGSVQFQVHALPCAATQNTNVSVTWDFLQANGGRLRPVLPGPALDPPHSAPRPGTPAGGGAFCLSAAPPTVSNNVAVIVEGLGSAANAQPELPAAGEWASALFSFPCGKAVPLTISVATERDAATARDAATTKQPISAAADDSPVDELRFARSQMVRSKSAALVSEHLDWWAAYWNRSAIELPTEPPEFGIVREWYYCMLYLLRSSTRLGSVAPSLWGPFSTTDLPGWGDVYTLDYNQEANFWGAQTANHPELILPFLDTITYLVMPNAAARARLLDWSLGGKPHLFGAATACMGCGPNGQSSPSELGNWDDCGGCPPGFGGFRGLEFPSATGPFEGMIWFTDDGCRFVGGLVATNFIQYYDATRNYTFLEERMMPLLRGISDFYVSYAVPSNSSIFGPFGVRRGATADELSFPFTCSQEVCGGGAGGAEHNSMQDLSYARMVWTKLLEYSDPDPVISGAHPAVATKEERAVWADSLRRLAAFKTVTAVATPGSGQPNRTIFSESEPTLPNSSHTTYRGDYFWHANQGYPITHFAAMWPAGVISRNSDPALVKIAKATLLTLERGYAADPDGVSWTPANGYCLAWPGAARLAEADDSAGIDGLSGRYLLTRFGRSLNRSMTLSGWPNIMGGLEEMGAMDAVHSLLMLSDDGVLELFAGWPSTANASFETLRANGGFLVSSGYNAATKTVTQLEVVSEAGRWLTVASPWDGTLCAKNVTAGSIGTKLSGLPLPIAAGRPHRSFRFETVIAGRYFFEPCHPVVSSQ